MLTIYYPDRRLRYLLGYIYVDRPPQFERRGRRFKAAWRIG